MTRVPRVERGSAQGRLDEPARLFTRADALVVVASLGLAGLVAARRWFGLGGRGSETDEGAGAEGAAPQGSSGLYAVVQNDEGFREALPLATDAQVTVTSSLGTNVIEVSGGRVRVERADCANQVCVNAGWASLEGQTITCLPHRLVVEVVSDPADASSLAS